jgi:glutathione synthase
VTTAALFLTDPLGGLDAGIDSSVGLMAAAQEHDVAVWVCQPEDLALDAGRLVARAARLSLRPRTARGDHRWLVEAQWYDEVERARLDVGAAIDVVFLRPDPPVDPRYLRTTYLLDVAAQAGVRVVNDPAGVRQVQEKLFPLRFPDLCPATMATADASDAVQFLATHGAVVVKPVDGFSGIDVWLLRADDSNARSLIESATDRGRRHALFQEYLPAVTGGNKRLFLLDGEIIGTVDRLPSDDDFRIGPPSAAAEPDDRDRAIVDALAPDLLRHGIALAGLDVIDGRLIEVNVTCPGGMHKTDALLGTDLSGEIVRRLLLPQPTKERLLA